MAAGSDRIDRVDGPQDPSARTDVRQRFQAIVSEAEEGVVILEPNGTIGYANGAAEFLLGHRRSELQGEMFGLPLAPRQEAVTINVVAQDGTIRTGEMRIEPLLGDARGTMIIRVRDITAHSIREASVRDEVRRRDEFLAMLSHELRNPLSAIQNAAQLLGLDELGSPDRREASAVLDRQFQHLRRILDDLLDVARILRGKLIMTPRRVELNPILHDALDAAYPLISRRNHAVEVDIPREAMWVWGDPTRLEQIAVNLLTNAAKFTPAGGRISLAACRSRGDAVEIRVSDNGPGIPETLHAQIFESFVQGPQSLERTEGGLGIGLMLVRTFAALHGGRVEIRNNAPAPGATFTVYLPLIAEETGTPGEERAAPDPQTLRVLLVEDSDDSRRMLKLLLESEGHGVLEAATGPEGLSAILRDRPDVALVDIGLPGLDGYEIAREVRRRLPESGLRLVALTGYGTAEDVNRAQSAGFDEHLVKPISLVELRRCLAQWHGDGHPLDGHPPARRPRSSSPSAETADCDE